MKKLILPVLALPLLMVCCAKDASVSSGTEATTVNVTDASEGMSLAKTSFSGNELIMANYTVAGADSIYWAVDTIPSNPGTDTLHNPGSDTVHYPGGSGSYDTTHTPGGYDTTYTPGGDTVYTPTTPPADTLGNGHGGGHDTTYIPGGDTTYVPVDSTGGGHHSGNGSYIVSTKNGYVEMKIIGKGQHVLVAKAYKQNSNGTYTLIKTGYIKFSAF